MDRRELTEPHGHRLLCGVIQHTAPELAAAWLARTDAGPEPGVSAAAAHAIEIRSPEWDRVADCLEVDATPTTGAVVDQQPTVSRTDLAA